MEETTIKLKRNYDAEISNVDKLSREYYIAKKNLEEKMKRDLLNDLGLVAKKHYIALYKGVEYEVTVNMPELTYIREEASIRVRFLKPQKPRRLSTCVDNLWRDIGWEFLNNVTIIREAEPPKPKRTKEEILKVKQKKLAEINEQALKIQAEINRLEY